MKMLTNNAITTVDKRIDVIHVQGLEEPLMFEVKNTIVQEKIVDVSASIPTNEIASLYPHLQDLNFPKLEIDSVELLLGQNVQSAFCISEIRYGGQNDPHGLHLGLGWALWGVDHLSSSYRQVDRFNMNLVQEGLPDNSCNEIIQALETDFKDIEMPQLNCMSNEDKQALKVFEESVTKNNGHYVIGLPWRDANIDLPDNRRMAEKRLSSLKRRLLQDPDLCNRYCDKMSVY